MKMPLTAWSGNRRSARLVWGKLTPGLMNRLRALTLQYALSVDAGDLQLLNGCWYVTHAGLLGIAVRKKCSCIKASLQKDVSDPPLPLGLNKIIAISTVGMFSTTLLIGRTYE